MKEKRLENVVRVHTHTHTHTGNLKNKKGITLVALVITIIILLILAGITISQLTGSGLFENAKLAEEKSKNAQEKEEYILQQYSNSIDKIVSNNREAAIDNGEIRFYDGNNGFECTSGEMEVNSYGLTYKTFPTEVETDGYYHVRCEKLQNINLNSKFEMSAQIYFNNEAGSTMGGLGIKLLNNEEKVCEFRLSDNWLNEGYTIISSNINNNEIYNVKQSAKSGRFAIIGDGNKAYFYWGTKSLVSVDYTKGMKADKIVIEFLKYNYTGVNAPLMHIEDLYVGEPLYYKSLIQ